VFDTEDAIFLADERGLSHEVKELKQAATALLEFKVEKLVGLTRKSKRKIESGNRLPKLAFLFFACSALLLWPIFGKK
jgi:hypothetical protein